jgi:hypothetical protein
VILEILAEGIRAAFEQRAAHLGGQLRAFGAWLREVSVPPSGLELRVIDGSQYTGLVLVERNSVIAVLAFRQGFEPCGGTSSYGSPRPPSPPSPSRWSPEPRPLEPRWRHEEDEPLWRTDDTVYR